MPIDLLQLRTFVTVAEEQHLTRAADRLYMSQSAASAHVRAIEEALDMPLFVRANRTLHLTRAGELLLQEAKTLLNGEAQFTSFARKLRGKIEGKLVVGISSEPGTRIGAITTALRSKYPLVSMDLKARPSFDTRQGIKSGELDVGILLGQPFDAHFTYYHLANMRFRVAGPAAWKQQIETADWSQLASLPWLTPSASSVHPGVSSAYSTMLSHLFGDKGLKLNSVILFDNVATGRAAAQEGAAMMLIREEYALQGEQEGYLAVSPIASAEVALSVAHQMSRTDDPLIEAFVDATSQAWPDMKKVKAVDLERARPS